MRAHRIRARAERVGAEELLLIVLLTLLGAMSAMVEGRRYIQETVPTVRNAELQTLSPSEQRSETLHLLINDGKILRLQKGTGELVEIEGDLCAPDFNARVAERMQPILDATDSMLSWQVLLHVSAQTPVCAYAQVRLGLGTVNSTLIGDHRPPLELQLEVQELNARTEKESKP